MHPAKVSFFKESLAIICKILSIFFPLAEKYFPLIFLSESEKDLNTTSYG